MKKSLLFLVLLSSCLSLSMGGQHLKVREGRTIIVSWDSNTEPDLSHYFVYFMSLTDTTKVKVPKSDSSRTQVRRIVDLIPNLYKLQVTAVDTAGNESLPSVPILFEVLPRRISTPTNVIIKIL